MEAFIGGLIALLGVFLGSYLFPEAQSRRQRVTLIKATRNELLANAAMVNAMVPSLGYWDLPTCFLDMAINTPELSADNAVHSRLLAVKLAIGRVRSMWETERDHESETDLEIADMMATPIQMMTSQVILEAVREIDAKFRIRGTIPADVEYDKLRDAFKGFAKPVEQAVAEMLSEVDRSDEASLLNAAKKGSEVVQAVTQELMAAAKSAAQSKPNPK